MADFEIKTNSTKTLASILGKNKKLSTNIEPPSRPSISDTSFGKSSTNFLRDVPESPKEIRDEPIKLVNDKSPIIQTEINFPNSINQNDGDWQPIIRNTFHQTILDKKSLAYYVYDLRNIIVKRIKEFDDILKNYNNNDDDLSVHDINLMKNFVKNFKDVEKSWNELIDKIGNLMESIDKYKTENYFGLKDKISAEISNIALSFILIGAKEYEGPGINEFKRLYDKKKREIIDRRLKDIYKIEPISTIQTRIDTFLEYLPKKMEEIAKGYYLIKDRDDDQGGLLNGKNFIESQLMDLRKKIKNQEKNIKTISDPEERKQEQEHLNNNKKSYEIWSEKLNDQEKKIRTLIREKNDYQSKIYDIIEPLFSILQFNYFYHKDWFPSLDINFPH